LHGAIQRAGRTVLAWSGGTHPDLVAEDQTKATAHPGQLPLCVQPARPVPHLGRHAASVLC